MVSHYGKPFIRFKQIAKRVLRKGCGGINFQDPPSNTCSVILFDRGECHPERISLDRDKLNELLEEERESLIEASDFLYAMQNAKTGFLKWVSFGVRSDVKLPLTSAPENCPLGSVSADITDDAPKLLFLVWRPASRYTDGGVPKAAALAKGRIWRDGQDEGSPVDSSEKLARWLRFR
ncbi:hypothetical protein AKJ37_00725 [candidate division MSBL1 archaeon SCGC-AAA259I09]|uniref:Uncharacterized protein n=1 Tax=candidate division MSBL1 archaeon SCGC-AAA259I09 TaxID=1698267 RepID=A0A133UVN5_9EURY|nr:hypothetical protein AKJ37_00725 [candidate division MSBL1 archaeon SCGC-AAA259I09]